MRGPDAQHDEELEDAEKERKESELDRAQNQYGNAALSALLGVSASGSSGDGGGADVAMEMRPAEQETQGPAHGGDADPVDDAPLTIEDLTQGWNPRLKREKERPDFDESMPDLELPDEDGAWLDAIRAAALAGEAADLPASRTPDGLLQPSRATVLAGLTRWIREAGSWTHRTATHRVLAAALAPPAACLQDSAGRVLLARARTGAAATALLLDGAQDLDDDNTAALVQLCLEIAGSTRLAAEVEHWAALHAGELPSARAVGVPHLPFASEPQRWRRLHLRDPAPGALARLASAVHNLADLAAAGRLLPSLPEALEPEVEDDPLGLDAILQQHTGGAPDPDAALYQTCVAAAEKLAGAIARARVRLAAASSAVAAASRHWSSGPPTPELLDRLTHFDQDSGKILHLLVEIARAAQRRTVAIRGIQNGLKRAARQIDELVRYAELGLARIAACVLPDTPDLALPEGSEPDPLDLALRDGDPLAALPWVAQQDAAGHTGPSPTRRVTEVLLAAIAGHPPARLIDPLRIAADAVRPTRPLLAHAVEQFLGSCMLWVGDHEGAITLAERHLALGTERRNGLFVASAALLGTEAHRMAGDDEAARRIRLRGGALAWRMAAPGALTLLARWTPPEAD